MLHWPCVKPSFLASLLVVCPFTSSVHIPKTHIPKAIRKCWSTPPQVDPSMQDVLPIEWVHVPKTGASFVNTLTHIPGVCPGLPWSCYADAPANTLANSYDPVIQLFSAYDLGKKCNTSVWDVNVRLADHWGLESLPGGFDAGKGRFMTFMRQPEQRCLSHLLWERKQHNIDQDTLHNNDFIHKVLCGGIMTKILTRSKYFMDPILPTNAEVSEAKRRLQTGFSFIGITDHWNLSMCLFNKMFNQSCRAHQFKNAHPTAGTGISTYNITDLNGWRDVYDGELYEVALKIFDANLKKYNVSESSCQPCWREAKKNSINKSSESKFTEIRTNRHRQKHKKHSTSKHVKHTEKRVK